MQDLLQKKEKNFPPLRKHNACQGVAHANKPWHTCMKTTRHEGAGKISSRGRWNNQQDLPEGGRRELGESPDRHEIQLDRYINLFENACSTTVLTRSSQEPP